MANPQNSQPGSWEQKILYIENQNKL